VNVDEIPAASRDKCGTCKADIIWTVSEAGTPHPVDLAPGGHSDKAANLRLTIRAGRVHSQVVKPVLAFGNPTLHLSHFVRCPQAQQHRRPRPAADRNRRSTPR
jgi:hypothetical protein